MSITRLQQARQMFQFGGGADMGASSGPSGPSGPPGSDNSGPVDRSSKAQTAAHNAAVASAQDYNRAQNEKNRTMFGFQKPPSVLSTIGGRIGDYITGGGLIGSGIRGLGSLFGGSTPSTGNVGPAGLTNDGTYGTVGDAVRASQRNEPPGEQGDNQGIMATYIPNMLDTAEEEDEIDNSLTDFLQRFRVDNQFRQDKQGQLDPAIIAMINRLYT